MIVLDTNALLWMATNSSQLGPKAKSLVRQARIEKQLAVSAASFWEIALLTRKGRLALERATSDLRRDLFESSIIEIAIDGQIAIDSVALDLPHRDPFDRIIVASAIADSATLITADRQIFGWPHALARHDALQ